MSNTRTELKQSVISTNKVLRDSVNEMSNVILLRNVHPSYRSDYAAKLLHEGKLTREQAKEFSKFV